MKYNVFAHVAVARRPYSNTWRWPQWSTSGGMGRDLLIAPKLNFRPTIKLPENFYMSRGQKNSLPLLYPPTHPPTYPLTPHVKPVYSAWFMRFFCPPFHIGILIFSECQEPPWYMRPLPVLCISPPPPLSNPRPTFPLALWTLGSVIIKYADDRRSLKI